MDNFNITPANGDVRYSLPEVTFPGYAKYMEQAKKLRAYILQLDVTEDSIKDVKKDLAKARKVEDALNAKRIEIKKEIMAGYDTFARQIKDITDVINDADSIVRQKVKQLEENERAEKEAKIREIWALRVQHYKVAEYANEEAYDCWFYPGLLNKSVPMKQVEAEMVDFLERTEKDLETLSAMDPEYEVEYLSCFNVTDAIKTVQDRELIRSRVNATIEDYDTEKWAFIVSGTKDANFTEMLLKNNEINFEKRRI